MCTNSNNETFCIYKPFTKLLDVLNGTDTIYKRVLCQKRETAAGSGLERRSFYFLSNIFPPQHFPTVAFPPTLVSSHLKAGELGEWGLLTTSSQRQNESEHSCCSWRWHHRPGCCCSLCLLPSQSSHGTCCVGRTQGGTLRVLEAQHPLLSGWNPQFPRV